MTTTEKIAEYLNSMPGSAQAEVLDFVEYLALKGRARKGVEAEWSALSLEQALRGMEGEPAPYSIEDLREPF